MKKILIFLLSAVLVFSLTVPAMAGSLQNGKNPSGDSFTFGDLIDLLQGSDNKEEKESDLSGILSEALDGLKEALPGIISSVEEALPGIISSIQESVPEIESGISELDPASAFGITQDVQLSPEEEEELQNLLDQLTGILGGAAAKPVSESHDLISGIHGSASSDTDDQSLLPEGLGITAVNPESPELISGAAANSQNETTDSVSSPIGLISGAISAENTAEETAEPETAEEGSDAKAVGGWKINTDAASLLTEDEAAIFEKAETTLAGGAYTPIAVIATQVVAGTNYAFLCLGAPEEPEDLAAWYIVTLYNDLSGDVTTLSIRELDLTDIADSDSAYNPAFVGSWTPNGPSEEEPVLPDDAQEAFENATAHYVGVGYSPIALLGTQLVSGTNYRFLCYGTLVTRDPVTSWYVVDIYRDLDGECTITDVRMLDLTDYIDYGGPEEETTDIAEDTASGEEETQN